MNRGTLRAALAALALHAFPVLAVEPVEIGNRRELFVDDHIIERLDGVELRLTRPVARETVLTFEHPWEGIYSGYITVFRDGHRLRMYYRGLPVARHSLETEVTCYAESVDGVHWVKPELGLVEVAGTRANNVILARHRACHNFAPFLDSNPNATPDARYKALGGTGKPGLVALVSADGLRWRDLQEEPVITQGAFDSQNVSFWSDSEEKYVCYFRVFREGKRWIARATSDDFVHWSEPVDMELDGKPREHLYTNQTTPYLRAPHIYLGFPTRFLPGRRVLSAEQLRRLGTPEDWGYGNDCADVVFTSTRGGSALRRTFMESFVRPGLDLRNWTSRASYAACGIIAASPTELSFFVSHNLGYPTSHLRRYTIRPDGFVAVHAPYDGGELLSRLLVFSGNRLRLNVSTSAAGGMRVEIQDAAGTPLDGFGLGDCVEIVGDELDRIVFWKGGADVGSLAGQPVRLRFILRDADLYALRFSTDSPGS